MILKDTEFFLSKDIFSEIKNANKKENIVCEMLETTKSFLLNKGIPTKEDILEVDVDTNGSYYGKYKTHKKRIELYPNSIKHNNFKYFSTLIHESTHLIQDFIISNGISRENIDNLNLEKYQKMTNRFYKRKDVIVTERMLMNLKDFIKEEPFFENNKIKVLMNDWVYHTNHSFSYYNNTTELMAHRFVLKELNDTFLKENVKLDKLQIVDIRECLRTIGKSFEKTESQLKTKSIIYQVVTAKPLSHIHYLRILLKTKLPLKKEQKSKDILEDIKNGAVKKAESIKNEIILRDDNHIFTKEKNEQILKYIKEQGIVRVQTRPCEYEEVKYENKDIFYQEISKLRKEDNAYINMETNSIYKKELNELEKSEKQRTKERLESEKQKEKQIKNNKDELDLDDEKDV